MKKAIRDRGDGSTVPCGTDITVPLSHSTSDPETRKIILWHINDLYNENAENWQSVSIQQQRINAETGEFLRGIK